MTTATPVPLAGPATSGEVLIAMRLYVEPMNDEWRLQIDVQGERDAGSLTERLNAAELEHELSEAFHDRLIVSGDGPRVFVYAGTRDQVESARGADRPPGEDARAGRSRSS